LDGKEKIRPDCEEAEKGDDAAHHGHTQREAIGEGYRKLQEETEPATNRGDRHENAACFIQRRNWQTGLSTRTTIGSGASRQTYYGFRFGGKGSVRRGRRVLVSQITQMPGPDEPLGEDDKRTNQDGQANGRGGMTDMISRAKQQDQNNIPEPT
jgi:hypothetical protein